MEQPKGFVASGQEHLVCRLRNTLVAWTSRINFTLVTRPPPINYGPCTIHRDRPTIDPCVLTDTQPTRASRLNRLNHASATKLDVSNCSKIISSSSSTLVHLGISTKYVYPHSPTWITLCFTHSDTK